MHTVRNICTGTINLTMDFPPYDRENPHQHWLELFKLHDFFDLHIKYTAKKYYDDCKAASHYDVEAMSERDLAVYKMKYGYTRAWVAEYKWESFSKAWAQAGAKAKEIAKKEEDCWRWNRAEGKYYKSESELSLLSLGLAVDIEIGALKLGSVSEVKITEEHTVLSTGLVVVEEDEAMLHVVRTELQSRGADAIYYWSQELQLMASKIARLKQEADEIVENNRVKRLLSFPIDHFQQTENARDLSAAIATMNNFMIKYPTLDAYRKLLLQRQKGQQTKLARTEHGNEETLDDAKKPASRTEGDK